jgi:hypothetical protein
VIAAPRGKHLHRALVFRVYGEGLPRKKVVRVETSRQHLVWVLRNAGMREIADLAETTLPDPVDSKTLDQFCAAHGISESAMMDLLGGSP